MKLLVISTNYSPELTGIGKYSGEMCEWLAKNNHDVTVVCSPPYYPEWKVQSPYSSFRYQVERINNVTVIRCPIWVPNKTTGLKRILHLLSFSISSFPIIIWQTFKSFDVVFTVEPSFLNSFAAIIAAKLSRAKSVLHIQDFEIEVAFELGIIKNKVAKKILYYLERKVMAWFDVVSTSSEAMIDLLLKKQVKKNKTYLFPNWVDTKQIYPLNRPGAYRKELNIADEYSVVLYSGNMGVKQGLEIVIQAAGLLKKEKIVFLLCGTGAAKDKLVEQSKQLSNVIWMDLQPLNRLNELLNTADIHVLPQLPGAADLLMPSKLNGMLSSGKPIVATAEAHTQVEKVVSQCGLVTSPCHENEFAHAILSLVNSPKQARLFGIKAREYAQNWLEYDSIMTRFENKLLFIKSISNVY